MSSSGVYLFGSLFWVLGLGFSVFRVSRSLSKPGRGCGAANPYLGATFQGAYESLRG